MSDSVERRTECEATGRVGVWLAREEAYREFPIVLNIGEFMIMYIVQCLNCLCKVNIQLLFRLDNHAT